MHYIRFEYLFRDGGNYKTYGELILANPNLLTLEEASREISEFLIDGEYFYPGDVGVPLIVEEDPNGFKPWYEFIRFSEAENTASSTIIVEDFIARFKYHKHS